MVEKIDRPDAPPPWRINEAKHTAEDRHQQQNPREEMEEQRRKSVEEKDWSKFGRRTTTIKPLRVPREQVLQCRFRSVNLHSGIGTLEVDVRWRDGRVTPNALMLVTRLEDFIALKKLTPGQPVPESFWARGATVEIGIRQVSGEAAAMTSREILGRQPRPSAAKPAAHWLSTAGILDPATGKIGWGIALMYLFVIALALLGAILAIRKTW